LSGYLLPQFSSVDLVPNNIGIDIEDMHMQRIFDFLLFKERAIIGQACCQIPFTL
jgi:hypothetical protein